MKINTSIRYHLAWAAMALLLAACGGGGYKGDTTPSTPPFAAATGLDRFLLFPNPQAEPEKPNGPYQTNTLAYAQAYYKAIDPNNDKDTLDKWKAANNFDQPSGIQKTAVFGDKRDLGYGRRMTARYDPITHNIAFLVENYVVNPGEAYGYSKLSVEAAVAQDTRWRIGINAIEFSPGPNGRASFAKFFNFDSQTGQRELTVDLDFRGTKAMPGPCITCHGGRGDALNADGSFPLVRNAASQVPGDVQAHLALFEVESLDFLDTPGFKKEEQQDELRLMNLMVLCTYPSPTATTVPCDASLPNASRQPVSNGQWQGTATVALIEAAYGGSGTPNPAYKEPDIPSDWVSAGQTTLYRDVVVPSCRMCHMLRGTGAQPTSTNQPIEVPSDIDFTTFDKFASYSERIKVHVFDRGNMPLAKLVYDNFWASSAPEVLATFLKSQSQPDVLRDAATGTILRPGLRPIADPGPARVAEPNATVPLSAVGSLFADSYAWSIVSGTPPPILGNTNSKDANFKAAFVGEYKLQLVASKGSVQSIPKTLTIIVKSTAPSQIGLFQVRPVLSNICTSCHNSAATDVPVSFDTGDQELLAALRGRINFTDIVASPLLRKPSGHHHGGGTQALAGFDASNKSPGEGARASYDLFLNWILNGAPR